MDTTKRCADCGETKQIDHFYRNRRTKDGRNCYCIDCQKKRAVAYNNTEAAKEKAKVRQRRQYAKFKSEHNELNRIRASVFPGVAEALLSNKVPVQ